MTPNSNNLKEQEIIQRRAEVERFHIQGLSASEISEKLQVDVRTIGRDIHENRKERLGMLKGSPEAKQWLRNELADHVAFMDSAKREFYQQAETFKNESSKTKALWNAVQTQIQKMETIKSIIWSLHDVEMGGFQIGEFPEEDET